MLTYKGLFHKFDKTIALDIDRVDLTPGSVYGVVGPNGSGKTTLFRKLSGNLDAEKIEWDISGITQSLPAFCDQMYVKEILGLYSSNQGDSHVDACKYMGISSIRDKRISQLSFGQYQRLIISISFILDSKVILLDEPLNGLDQEYLEGFYSLVKNCIRDRVLLVSGHQIDELTKICDEMLLLKDGKIQTQISKEKFLRDREDLFILKINKDLDAGCSPLLKKFKVLESSLDGEVSCYQLKITKENTGTDAENLFKFIGQNIGLVYEFKKKQPSMDEYFRFFK